MREKQEDRRRKGESEGEITRRREGKKKKTQD